MTTNIIHKSHPPETQHAKLKKPFARRKRRGFISIEYMFVLGLIVVGIVSVIALASTMQKSWRATQLTTQVTQIVSGLQRAYASSPSYDTGNLITVLDGGGDIPAAARGKDENGDLIIQTPYGDLITVMGVDQNAVITITKLPEEACERFLEGFVGLNVKNTDIRKVTVDNDKLVFPLTRLAISTKCTNTADGNDVAITY